MNGLKSLDMLRSWIGELGVSRDLRVRGLVLADAVAGDIEWKFAELPVDSEGGVWRPGDMYSDPTAGEGGGIVGELCLSTGGWMVSTPEGRFPPGSLAHRKNPTVGELLIEFAGDIAQLGPDGDIAAVVSEFEERIGEAARDDVA